MKFGFKCGFQTVSTWHPYEEADTDGDGLIDFEEFVSLLQMDPTDQLDAYEWRVSRPSVQASEEVVVEA